MNEIEIAAGAAIAAQHMANAARKRNQDEQQFTVEGSRARACANANSELLKDASEACEMAVRKLMDAAARFNRMNDF